MESGNENKAIVVAQQAQLPAALPTAAILEQVQSIQDIMHRVMRDGEHYGKIPGCGPKPSLLKPGAEKLAMTFRLCPKIYEEIVDLAGSHREARVKVELYSVGGNFLGSGIGSCSTMEAKYRYRSESTGKPVPKEYWDSRDSTLLGGPDFSARKVEGKWIVYHRVEHDNPADHWNTVVKMAKKRAYVDAILTVTAASDIFTQDVEEMVEPETIPAEDAKAKLPVQATSDLLTQKQLSLIGVLEKQLGLNENPELLRNMLKEDFGVDSHKKLTKQQASELISNFKSAIQKRDQMDGPEASTSDFYPE